MFLRTGEVWLDLGLIPRFLGVLAALICRVEVRSASSISIFTISFTAKPIVLVGRAPVLERHSQRHERSHLWEHYCKHGKLGICREVSELRDGALMMEEVQGRWDIWLYEKAK